MLFNTTPESGMLCSSVIGADPNPVPTQPPSAAVALAVALRQHGVQQLQAPSLLLPRESLQESEEFQSHCKKLPNTENRESIS